MLIIEDKIVSLDLFDEYFVCAIDKCKGACCVEGDFGAPLEDQEISTLKDILPHVLPRMTDEGRASVKKHGVAVYYDENEEFGTPLVKSGACAFMRYDGNGNAKCTIEETYNVDEIAFRKPISCHLYPIRVNSIPAKNFEALNYDRWEICNAACSKGSELGVKIYQFAKDALVRKYGLGFYNALEAFDHQYSKTDGKLFE